MKYSILIPCYRCARYIRATLDSVLVQKSQDWEMICVDDGSPDDTGIVLDEYLRKHFAGVTAEVRLINGVGDEDRAPDAPKRVLTGRCSSGASMTVVHQCNCGVSGARNTALALATGEWLVYLDGDDLLSPQALDVVENCLAQIPEADIVECGYVNFNDGEALDWGVQQGKAMSLDVSKTIPSDPFGACFQRFVFRRETVKGIAYKGVSCTEEIGYMVRCFIRARTVAKTDDIFYGYRVLAGSMSHQGISFELCINAYDVTRCVTRLLFECDKCLPPAQCRGLINRWSEMQMELISSLSSREERDRAWRYWCEKLPRIRLYRSFCTKWQWVSICACLAFRSRMLAYLLFFVPRWLKMKGVHR